MYLNFKRWIKGDDDIHAAKLSHIDVKFKQFIREFEQYNLDEESIFIYGMLNLLKQLHKNDRKYFDRLRILLETYKIFLRDYSHFKNHNLSPLQINTIIDRSEIHLYGFFTPPSAQSDGSPECYNLVESLSNFIENSLNTDRENLLMFTLNGVKH